MDTPDVAVARGIAIASGQSPIARGRSFARKLSGRDRQMGFVVSGSHSRQSGDYATLSLEAGFRRPSGESPRRR
jgi:hypothetical protein